MSICASASREQPLSVVYIVLVKLLWSDSSEVSAPSSLKSAFVGSCASFGLSTAQLEEMERISELPHRRPEAMSTSTWRRRARLASSSRREREEDPSAQAPHVIAERPPSPGRHLSCSGSLYSCHQHSNE